MSIARKSLIGALIVSAIAIFSTALIISSALYFIADEAIVGQSEDSLLAIKELQIEELENYLVTIRKQIITVSNSATTKAAATDFTENFEGFESASGLSTENMRSELSKYYVNEYGAKYQEKNPNNSMSIEALLQSISSEAVALQYHFIQDNPNPLGAKDSLNALNDSSPYNSAHQQYHPEFRTFLQTFNYYDIFIVDSKSGHVVYSVFKELDYATSLLDGPYSDSGLAEVFKALRNANDENATAFSPFKSYTPSYEDPASFIASPILDANGNNVAVLVFQMPIDDLNSIMTHSQKWEKKGLGLSGETYLVGENKMAQSLSRFLIEDAENYYSAIAESGIDEETISTIKAKGTNIGFQAIDTPGVRAALAGSKGFDIFDDYRGVPVLSSYAPVEFEGYTMALLVEIDKEEAYAFEQQMLSSALIWSVVISLIILALVGFIVWRYTNALSESLNSAVGIANTVAKGDKANITGQDRPDELGALMTALDTMQTELIGEFERAARETSRVTSALRVASTNLMMADNDFNIVYMNDSVKAMFKTAESDLRKDLPNFDASNLEGKNIDIFHKNPAHQRQLLSALNTSYESGAKVGGRTFRIIANPVYDANKERIGTVIEWFDETDMLRKQAEEKIEAQVNLRLKQALDNVSSSVMVADADNKVVYMNSAVDTTLRNIEEDIQTDLPHFRVDDVLGKSIDIFHKDPEHQKQMLQETSERIDADIKLGGRDLSLIANPVMDQSGERVGTVLEWSDNTETLAKAAQEKREAAENLRLKQALDNVSANVMVADADRNIVYMNYAVTRTLKNAESDLRKGLPNFDASKLLGQTIDVFHQNPAHQRKLLEELTAQYNASIVVGGRYMDLAVNPVMTEEGERAGTVVEWFDRTAQVAIQKEVDSIVTGAKAGDMSGRIELAGKDGFFAQLSEGLNDLLDNTEQFVGEVGQIFQAMAEGALDRKMSTTYQGEFMNISDNANSTMIKLADVLKEISTIASVVTTSANEVSQGSNDLSQRTESQASSLEETASSMEEITATVQQSAENSVVANKEATEAKARAESGGEVVQQAINAMAEILESSNKINDIIGVIDEIAFQTNLLALNAAVEAARAGEQGRGFAVVAGEVRNLSQRSAAAAKEIKNLIRDSVSKVEAGSSLVNESGSTLGEIVSSVEAVAMRISEVNDASREQTSGIGQINQAITQMDTMTQQNAALVEETSAASRSMAEQAEKMQSLIRFFRF